jgi:hypothetical protein
MLPFFSSIAQTEIDMDSIANCYVIDGLPHNVTSIVYSSASIIILYITLDHFCSVQTKKTDEQQKFLMHKQLRTHIST